MKKFICCFAIFYLSTLHAGALDGKVVLQKAEEIWRPHEVFSVTALMDNVSQFYGFSISIQYDENYLEPVKNQLDLGAAYKDKKVFIVSNCVGDGKVRLTGTLLGKENEMPQAWEWFTLAFKTKKEGSTTLKIENIKIINRFGEKQDIPVQDLKIIVNSLKESSDGYFKNRDHVREGIGAIEILGSLKDEFEIIRMDEEGSGIKDLLQRSPIYRVEPKGPSPNGSIRIAIPLSKDTKNHHALGIYQLDENKGYWRYGGGEVDLQNGKINGEVNLSQKFAVFEYMGYRDFKDVGDPRTQKEIKRLVMEGIVQGYEDHTFRPGKKVTREEFMALLLKARRMPIQVCEEPWEMEGVSAWARDILYTAYQCKIIKGYDDGNLRGNQEITRVEAAVILDNILKLELEKEEKSTEMMEALPPWAGESVGRIQAKGLMGADRPGNFYPEVKITRIEMVKILNRLRDIED